MHDEYFMDLALKFATVGEDQTSPNPVVGAIIVKEGAVVGFGAHLSAGSHHAEVHALNMAGENAVGSTMYVTLEPCNHYGKTPPCTMAILNAGIKKVVVATLDPNPKVAGTGVTKLKDAGIEVEVGLCEAEAVKLNKAYFHFMKQKLPFVTLKQAITLDGKIATVHGKNENITGKEVQEDVHRKRGQTDAILVGVGTVLTDDPLLTNRFTESKKQPIRIILDTHLRTPINAKVITDQTTQTWIVVGLEVTPDHITSFAQDNVQVIQLKTKTIAIQDVLQELARRNIVTLYVEGGQRINTSFIISGLVNEMITYIAPKLVGDHDGMGMLEDLEVKSMADAVPLKLQQVDRIGDVIKVISGVGV
ncbi:bifunctional diaminohydroxyphosphoribosylaminopyrimidine deaminase/5-amino-6-(5-phosphoribosylamino)uracil reductase RibD [Viridibacillus sp. FSL H8-0123]|uniref:bifunctional diaminohydroxyphosphoribosylaminopyrimidine deaminase/5-amino-6-(5-phosphoribosylamino)uracil reductase RibD n=1 Tax=Viridibacillus sp. FSL H8-0123 TaxID=1928922 RepID=UPI00096FAEB3|nr:bifunctional diaminohydroxyphosphoribosylaminopyrimidine deaminase/5-amino-6-(5-phosphoribosylamino)uracil reductase RibD [Viridibacillus sp. FSL H8-0123]OMC83502.1 riboflavin biosynthesis protein RibD [Viridibacillus sp. FSL H8-0123]